MTTKTAKYFQNHKVKGMKKSVAAREAGITNISNLHNIENTKTYQALEAKYAKKLEAKLSLDEVADEHIKIIKQDQDKGAKLNAIKYYKENVEPEENKGDDDDRVIVVFR